MTHTEDIKRIREDLKKLNNESLTIDSKHRKEIESDITIEIKSYWTIQGDEKTRSERLAKLSIYGYTTTSKELEVLLESLKMVYMNHPDGEIKMEVKYNYEYLNG
tara:strand:- start:283 stop:597 length:315 start_codon:yes stop_codon:yes gene_type:complete